MIYTQGGFTGGWGFYLQQLHPDTLAVIAPHFWYAHGSEDR